MYLYIDESGDPGLNVDLDGTSPHFVLAAIYVEHEVDLETCRQGLASFNAGRYKRKEFKFSKCSDAIRHSYLLHASRLPWTFFGVILNKAALRAPDARTKIGVYEHTTSLLMEGVKVFLTDAFVIFDSCGSREFKDSLQARCKLITGKADGTSGIKRATAQHSHSDPMLQLADMVAGAVARAYKSGLQDPGAFLQLIAKKQSGFQAWGMAQPVSAPRVKAKAG